ncbi:hypothetical protein [Archangium gephyra]|uniref:hypothetical protein n=1 Tax=Archangium gephyra TaxID=48 RepID=UPI0011C0EDCD|nr:hypothetical protein [Archangium gephyra]
MAARAPEERRPSRPPQTALEQRRARRFAPPEEQRPTRQPQTTEEQAPKDRSSTAVILGWFGLLVGGLSALSPVLHIMPLPFALLSPVVMLVLGNRALVMAGRDLEDIHQERLPPEVKGRVTHARVLGVLNIVGGLLSCTLMGAVVWFFARAFR